MRFDQLKRREFITLLGGAAAAWPLSARGQQAAMPIIGFLNSGSPDGFVRQLAAFRQSLSEAGYVERRTVTIEYRWAHGRYDRLQALADELVHLRVAVLVATGGTVSAVAAKSATSTIPIVFTAGGQLIKLGLVASLNRPGANVTGISLLADELLPKRLAILRELVPNAGMIAALVNPRNPNSTYAVDGLRAAAQTFGQKLNVFEAATVEEIDVAFANMARQQAGAVLIISDAFFANERAHQLVDLTRRYAIPAIFDWREIVVAGGLMSYGTSLPDAYRQAAVYVARLLKGDKPADLPVLQPTKFEFVINLRTAKMFGFEIPANLLALADEVIE